MGKTYKCCICGESVPCEEAIPYKARYAHKKCYELEMSIILKEKKKKSLEKTKTVKKNLKPITIEPPVSDEEYAEKTEFYDYYKKILGLQTVPVKVSSLSNKYNVQNNFTWKGMKQTLIWYFEILSNPIEQGKDYIGLMPYIYENAQNYFSNLERINKTNQEKDIKSYYKEKVIKVTPRKGSMTSMIDITEIK